MVGVTAAAQINTITIGGTIEVGDKFTAHIPIGQSINYTALDTDPAHVASGLNTAIHNSL